MYTKLLKLGGSSITGINERRLGWRASETERGMRYPEQRTGAKVSMALLRMLVLSQEQWEALMSFKW